MEKNITLQLITPELLKKETSPTLKKMYELVLAFKEKHNLESVELFWGGLNNEFLITPDLEHVQLDDISDTIDDLWSEYDEESGIDHDGCYFGFVTNKSQYFRKNEL